ncbi:MAG: class I SAM-dependent methyltransferase [Kiritimatiellae bacterium]|nr:class I SAM-dependent methyltransferase [Kiritimatiellia bacterium]
MKLLFAAIAEQYDSVNRVLSLGRDRKWRREAVEMLDEAIKRQSRVRTVNLIELAKAKDGELQKSTGGNEDETAGLRGRRVLDLACGTGEMAAEIIAKTKGECSIACLDLVPKMLKIAEAKIGKTAGAQIEYAKASAMSIPFAKDSFDAAVCAFGFRNFPESAAPLRQLRRVVKDGGRLCVVEFFKPKSRIMGFLVRAWIATAMFFIEDNAAEYRHLRSSISSFGGTGAFIKTAEANHWRLVRIKRFFPICTILIFK